MRFSKLFFVSVSVGLVTGGAVLHAETVNDCLAQGKEKFSTQEYEQARQIFSRCEKLEPGNVDAKLSLAGVQLTLEDLDGAEKTFLAALEKMPRTSPYVSYTYSMLGDIALKRQQNDKANDYYSKSLASNAANVNSLVGKGVITEYQGDKQGAAEYYRSALAVEPLNLIARQRLINLEPDYLTDEEMLAALKQRYAVKPEVTHMTDELRTLFSKIHQAEQRQGVAYLKNKYPKVPPEYVVTINKGTDFERDMLTLAGYQMMEKQVGQDAFAVFRKMGVPMKDIFRLRNEKGEKVFTKESTLTDSGFTVYTEALKNRKTFLLPNQSVPPTPAFLQKVERYANKLKQNGYIEISRAELKSIENQTKCSEETLRKEMGLYILPLDKKARRFFILKDNPKDAKKSVPYYYLMKAHSKRNPNIKLPSNSLVDSYAYYGYSVCLDDGKML